MIVKSPPDLAIVIEVLQSPIETLKSSFIPTHGMTKKSE